jgi:ABC-2 type transport system ATP-binding protein
VPAVVVHDLVIRYGETTAVNHTSWSAEAGRIVAVLGPNGAGKSSTIEALEGYREPQSGQVRVLGMDPRSDAKSLSPRIGVMLQRNGVYLTMRPREVLRLFAAYYGNRALDPDALLSRVGLDSVASTPWRRLSGGEQQRLSLALALVGRPEVAFLDEPTAMIDPGARHIVRDLVAELRNDGVCVVLTTHDLDDAERLADTVVILDHGTVVAIGTPAELTASTSSDGIVFDTGQDFDVDALSRHVGGSVSAIATGTYRVDLTSTPQHLSTLTSWLADHDVAVGGIRAGRRSLEEVFLRLTADTASTAAAQVTASRNRGRKRRERR